MAAPLVRQTGGGSSPAPPYLGPFAQFSPYAWMLPQNLWAREKRWFIYNINFVTPNQLVASDTRTQTVGINRDSYFAVVSISATVTNTDNTTFIDTPAILVTFTDTGSGALFMNTPTHFANLFSRGSTGDGKRNYLELPRLVDPGSTIASTLENQDATARHVRIALSGFRIYV